MDASVPSRRIIVWSICGAAPVPSITVTCCSAITGASTFTNWRSGGASAAAPRALPCCVCALACGSAPFPAQSAAVAQQEMQTAANIQVIFRTLSSIRAKNTMRSAVFSRISSRRMISRALTLLFVALSYAGTQCMLQNVSRETFLALRESIRWVDPPEKCIELR